VGEGVVVVVMVVVLLVQVAAALLASSCNKLNIKKTKYQHNYQ
jgi:hypothetical protein